MEWVCRVGTPTGEVIERSFAAPDEGSLRAELERQGLYLFSARRAFSLANLGFERRVAPALLQLFSQELAALLKAGLPLLQSLEVMLERQKEPTFRRSLEQVRDRVRNGVALSEAFRAEGPLYPPMFAASLVAGERSGSLETVLRRFSQYLRLSLGLRRKAIAASIYPLVLLTTMLGLIAVLLLRVIPQFESFYEGLAAELPLPTRVLLRLSDLATAGAPWLAVAAIAAFVGFRLWLGRQGSGAALDAALLKLPYFGTMLRMYATAQLARTLSTLLQGGLPLLHALDVAAASIGNRAMARAVAEATPRIREGRSLTASLEETRMLDDLALEMIKVGEHTGSLADMLNSVAEFYDEQLEVRLQAALALLEPIMLVLMAVIVAAMLLAFYLPMFEAISAIQGRL
jgi:type IV pilus assembly protein PilC